MSYSIEYYPKNTWLPCYNDIFFQVTSSNKTQPNHKYLATISVNGSAVKTFKVVGHPSTGSGVFIFDRFLTDYLSEFQFDYQTTNGIWKATSQYLYFSVSFGEEYGTPITQHTGLATSSTYYAWYAGFSERDNNIYNMADMVAKTSSSYILSPRATSLPIYQDQYDWIYFINDNTIGDVDKIVITATTSMASYVTEIGNDFNADKSVCVIPSGFNLNNVDSSFIDVGAQPILPGGTLHYTIQLKSSTDVAQARTYTRIVNSECTRFDEYDLVWINRFGGKDTIRCRMIKDEEVENTKQSYKKSTYGISGGIWTKDSYPRATTNFHTESTEIWTLRTDFLNDDESDLFRDLYDSSSISIIDVNTAKQYEVNFVGSNVFQKLNTDQGQLIKQELRLKFTDNYFRQRP